MKLLPFFLMVSTLIGCGEDDKKNPFNGVSSEGTGLSFGTTHLISTTLTDLALAEDTVTCKTNMDIYQTNGVCLTPIDVTGYSADVALGSDIPGPGVRILGEDENNTEPGKIIPGAEISLSDIAGGGLVGNNTLYNVYSDKPEFSSLVAGFFYLKVKFTAKSKFITMMLVASDQPLVDSDAISCVPESERTQSRYTQADILPGMTFNRGDYLFCVKDSATEDCDAEDFQWFDKDTEQLVDTRPSNPRQNKYIANNETNCSEESGRFDVSFSPIPVVASFADGSRFKLYADFSHGRLSEQWKDESAPLGDESKMEEVEGEEVDKEKGPYLIYYYEKGSEKNEGSVLESTFDINTTGMVYIDNLDDPDSEDLETILANVNTLGLWALNKKGESNIVGWSADHIQDVTAEPSISLSGGTERPEVLESDFD